MDWDDLRLHLRNAMLDVELLEYFDKQQNKDGFLKEAIRLRDRLELLITEANKLAGNGVDNIT